MIKHKLLTILCAFVSIGFVHAQTIPTATISPDCSKNGRTSRFVAPDDVEMVDLGLSVKWANMNVGATTPEGYGDYFAWGETSPKTTYNWSTYKYCKGSYDTMTKYCSDSRYGTEDNKTVLDPEDDAAHVNWGGNWRMPTYKELNELKTNCIWTWTTQNGVKGYKVTGKNGNSIFVPAAGYRYASDLNDVGSFGSYWSSLLHTYFSGGSYDAYNLYFDSSSVRWNYSNRVYGGSVRPVCP